MLIPMPDKVSVLPGNNNSLAGIWESGGKSSDEVGKSAHCTSSALSTLDQEVSDQWTRGQ